MDEPVQPSTGITRKKKKTPDKWKRNKAKVARLVVCPIVHDRPSLGLVFQSVNIFFPQYWKQQ